MSPILHAILTMVGGILAGLALAGALLWRQHQALQAVRYEATHDDLTGLPNRRLLVTRLRAALADDRPSCGLVLLDLDRFKAVNDTFGHDTGNVLLTQVGRMLACLGAPVEIAARLSGDEFALLVRGDHDDTAAVARAAWRSIGAAPIHLDNADISIRASVGYTHTYLQTTARRLLAEADEAMYLAKRLATGVCGYHPSPTSPQRRSRDRHYH